jgi:peptidyl-prolyl cis-trans isomerase B (cyclophilin B)
MMRIDRIKSKWTKISVLNLLLALLLINSCASTKAFEVGQIKTPMGEVLVWFYDDTPKHKAAFFELAESEYFNDYSFNRVIDNFVAQGGCPDTAEGFAYSVHLLEPEFEAGHKHVYGAFGAGRDDNPDKLSAACQFYIVQNKNGLPRLDDDYMIYGQVIKGMDVIDQMVKVEKDSINQPITKISMEVSIIKMTQKEVADLGFAIPKQLGSMK